MATVQNREIIEQHPFYGIVFYILLYIQPEDVV